MPVYVMKASLPYSEYVNWMRYFKFEHPDAHEIQLAVISHIIASGLGNKKSKFDNYLVRNPVKQKHKEHKVMSPTQVQAAFSSISKKMI